MDSEERSGPSRKTLPSGKRATQEEMVPRHICIEHPAGAFGHQVSSAKYHMHGAVIKIRSTIPSNSALVNSSYKSTPHSCFILTALTFPRCCVCI